MTDSKKDKVTELYKQLKDANLKESSIDKNYKIDCLTLLNTFVTQTIEEGELPEDIASNYINMMSGDTKAIEEYVTNPEKYSTTVLMPCILPKVVTKWLSTKSFIEFMSIMVPIASTINKTLNDLVITISNQQLKEAKEAKEAKEVMEDIKFDKIKKERILH